MCIRDRGVSTDPEKIESITGFPTPRKTKDVRAFLGLTGHYRRFAPAYAKTIEPMLELLSSHTQEMCIRDRPVTTACSPGYISLTAMFYCRNIPSSDKKKFLFTQTQFFFLTTK